MRSYLIDEIPAGDMDRINRFLTENALPSRLEGVFWAPLPEDLLNEEQHAHEGCRPHVFAVETGEDWMKLELFVRSLADMRCACAGPVTRPQRDFIFRFAHTMIRDLEIRT